MPNMVQVTSSNVDSIGYEPETQTLLVRFKNGGTYSYAGVPEVDYTDMLSAPSVGQFLHQRIKGVYPYAKVG